MKLFIEGELRFYEGLMQEGYKEKQNKKWDNYLNNLETIHKENRENFERITRRAKNGL